MVANKKEFVYLTPEYYKEYLATKKKCREYYKLVNTGFYCKTVNALFENELDDWEENLLHGRIPKYDESSRKAGKKRKGKALPLKHEQNIKYQEQELLDSFARQEK